MSAEDQPQRPEIRAGTRWNQRRPKGLTCCGWCSAHTAALRSGCGFASLCPSRLGGPIPLAPHGQSRHGVKFNNCTSVRNGPLSNTDTLAYSISNLPVATSGSSSNSASNIRITPP